MWATHVWNTFDFGADARNEGGENGQNRKGPVTFDRKYKKTPSTPTRLVDPVGKLMGGMMDVKFTKEELLKLNAKLNKIKAPKKK